MNTLTGTGALARLAFRRDRIMLSAWVYVLTALVAGTAYSFKKLYPTVPGRQEFAAAAGQNPALVSLYGPLFGNSIGSLTAWRYGGFAALGAGLMSIFIVIRHTRADEETGRLELLGSAVVGRHAAMVAALMVAVTANIALALLMSAGLIALGLPAAGSISLALAIAGCGLVFTAVAAITAQLAQTARAARGIAIAVLGATYLLRAVGDSVGGSGPQWLTWLSPIGWAELIRSFGQVHTPVPCPGPSSVLRLCEADLGTRWWVLALPLVSAVLLAAAAGVLTARRDYGAGLLPQRPGPARGATSLRSPMALAWRLHRGTLIGWVIGSLAYGTLIGSAAKGIGGLLRSSSIRSVLQRLGGETVLTNAYLAAIMSFSGLIAAGYAVSVVLRLRSEETEERADPVLATGTGRISWALSHLVIAAAGTVAILVTTGLGAGLGYALRSAGGGSKVAALIGAGLGQVPAALVVAGIAVALFGLAPRASVAGAWTALGLVILLLFLGALLQLSHWFLDISPFTHVPKLPGGAVSAAPLAWLSLIAVALAVAGMAGLRRRDLG